MQDWCSYHDTYNYGGYPTGGYNYGYYAAISRCAQPNSPEFGCVHFLGGFQVTSREVLTQHNHLKLRCFGKDCRSKG